MASSSAVDGANLVGLNVLVELPPTMIRCWVCAETATTEARTAAKVENSMIEQRI